LVVDDDPISLRAISGGLQVLFGRPDTAESGEAALVRAADKPFDLIFMDIQMPGMGGFRTCSEIHKTAANSQTPVVFVTGHADVECRELATLAGGIGFIQKPALASELRLTAITFSLRGRLAKIKPAQAVAAVEEAVC